MAGRGFPRANRVQTSIWDTRITDANQTTGDNFFGAVGGPADLFLIRDTGGVRQLEAIQTNGTATVFDTVDTNQAFVGSGDFNGDGLFDLLINVDNPPGVRTFLGLGELRVRNVAAQTRIISVAGIRLNPLKICAAFQRDNLRRHF